MAIFIFKHTTAKDAGLIQAALTAALGPLPLKTGNYQADIDTDLLYIDPAVGLTKAQIKALGFQKFGNGVSCVQGQFWFFVVDDAQLAAITALASSVKLLA